MVDETGLAHRVRTLSGRVADVVALLDTTNTIVGIDLVGLYKECFG